MSELGLDVGDVVSGGEHVRDVRAPEPAWNSRQDPETRETQHSERLSAHRLIARNTESRMPYILFPEPRRERSQK